MDDLVERGVIADKFDVQLNGYPLRDVELLRADGTTVESTSTSEQDENDAE